MNYPTDTVTSVIAEAIAERTKATEVRRHTSTKPKWAGYEGYDLDYDLSHPSKSIGTLHLAMRTQTPALIELYKIEADPKGWGLGSRVLRTLTEVADEAGITIWLDAIGTVNWFKGYGFEIFEPDQSWRTAMHPNVHIWTATPMLRTPHKCRDFNSFAGPDNPDSLTAKD